MNTHTTTGVARSALMALSVLVAAALTVPTAAVASEDLAQSVSSDEVVSTTEAVISVGHVDLGPKIVDGQWTVLARDDSGNTPVWRDVDHTVMVVGDAALMDAPTDGAYSFMGASAGEKYWVIPQTENPAAVWLGWNTQDPGVTELVDRGVTMSIGPVEGPGKAWMFLQSGTFGEPLLLVDGQVPAAQDVWVDVNTHVHANWVFTSPGVYLARLTFSADTVDGGSVSATKTLRFAVGDSTDPAEALAAVPSSALTGGEPSLDGASSSAPVDEGGAASAHVSSQGGSHTATSSLPWLVAIVVAFVGLVIVVLVLRRTRLVAAERDLARAEALADARGHGGEDR